MPSYIVLVNYTDQGIRDIKESPKRLAEVRQAIEKAGGRLHQAYLTMGTYDLVVIAEAPNDEIAATVILSIGRQGNVRTTTLRAFSEEEMVRIIGNIP